MTLTGQKCILCPHKSILAWRGDAIPSVDKGGKLLANEVQVPQPTTLPLGIEAQVCCRLVSESSTLVGLGKSCIRGDMGVTVATTVCLPGKGRRTLVRCINVSAQLQELRARSLIGILLLPNEE